jgi:predicted Zn-dependent peptidase
VSVTLVDGDPVLAVERFTLPCGLDVVIHPDPTMPLVAVSVWYRAGSSDERPGATGLAHLFEHLFKNSKHLAGRQHYEILRRAGAVDANASTGADRTAYHEIVPSAQLDLALWIESDRMGYFEPGLTEQRFRTQQEVVINERRQRYENVAYGAERFAVAEALYPEGHPHRHLTIGLGEDIAAATLADIVAWYRTWYVPANAQLVVAGDVDLDDARARITRWFGSFPAAARPARARPAAPRLAAPVRTSVEDRFAAIRRIHRVWASPAAFAPGDAELDVLASVLAAPGTGVLWRALVYDRPWAQRVQVWQASTRLGGELHVVVDLRSGAEPDAVRAEIDRILADLRLDPRAVARARTRRDAAFLWRLEGLGRRTAALQRYLLYLDDPHGLRHELARYREVTPEGVALAARHWLRPEAMVEVETIALRAGPAVVVTAPETDEVA